MSEEQPLLLCIMGPTAAGKTALAESVAQQLPGELISVDATLVYRGLDIGAARPQSHHHLVNICSPAESYSAARFLEDLAPVLDAVRGRGRVPILVGGSMLYFRAFLWGLSTMPPADPTVRKAIENDAAERGWPAIHKELARVDPQAAARIHPQHSQRLSRALEVYRSSGVPLSDWHAAPSAPPLAKGCRVIQVAICPLRREWLHARIAARFDAMLDAGLVDEVAALRARGDLDLRLPSMRSVGYRQIWQYLEGDCDLATARERAIAATRQLAKRQLTWLRKWPDLHWIHTDAAGGLQTHTLPASISGRENTGASDLLLNYLAYNPM
ncbi:MAG: tRNA (adenosine(37)-N6)-dimethylallyltransferase MiaA [Chromatocurvus sp.]